MGDNRLHIFVMEPELARQQLDRILGGAAFADAARAQAFLRFIVTLALEQRASEIKEYIIAVQVLGRQPSFDPKSDPIVRAVEFRDVNGLPNYILISKQLQEVGFQFQHYEPEPWLKQ